jgi:hypothetical protein
MDIIDFLAPQAAQASHLREIAKSLKAGQQPQPRQSPRLEADLGAVALVCMALVATLVEKGVISELDLQMQLNAIDGLDARQDGAIDPAALRQALGLQSAAPSPAPRGIPRPRRKLR